MIGLIAPLVIATVSLVGLGVFVYKRGHAGRAFDQVLADRGFTRQVDVSRADIDFTITLQWPDGRGITYVKQFAKEEAGALLTVANVHCWEVTGSRMAKLGAAMKPDEISQTVMSSSFPQRVLPRFCLCPTSWADQFRNLSEGGTEITTEDPAFDKAFFIVGPSKEDVTSVLTEAVRARMCSLSNVMLASGNCSVLLLRQAVVLPPPDLARFLDLLEMIRKEITRG